MKIKFFYKKIKFFKKIRKIPLICPYFALKHPSIGVKQGFIGKIFKFTKNSSIFQKKFRHNFLPNLADFAKYHFLTREFLDDEKKSCGSREILQEKFSNKKIEIVFMLTVKNLL